MNTPLDQRPKMSTFSDALKRMTKYSNYHPKEKIEILIDAMHILSMDITLTDEQAIEKAKETLEKTAFLNEAREIFGKVYPMEDSQK